MPSLGARFAHYRIEAVLGRGGMGQVYLAFDEKLHRQVALKVLLTSEPADAQRMVREARAAAAVEHPNKVTIFELGTEDGAPYIAMELIRGPTLREMVDDSDTSWQVALSHLVDVARSLDAAHAAGLVHRDIKPENVMVRDDGVVKVLDFGIARHAGGFVDANGPTATATAGVVVGTVAYMAPEQVRGEELDGRCDQFAWGVMAFELLTGEHPWGVSGDAMRLMSTMLTRPPRDLIRMRPDVPAALGPILARTLSPDRDARYPRMRDLVGDLLPLVTAGVRSPPEEPSAPPDTKRVAPSPPSTGVPTASSTTSETAPGDGTPTWRRAGIFAGAATVMGALLLVGFLARRTDGRATDPRAPGPVGSIAAGTSLAASSSSIAAPSAEAPPIVRRLCHPDSQDHDRVSCGNDAFQWCDAAGRKIACCADGLVAAGRDGMCICPQLSGAKGRARGCKDAPGAIPFTSPDVATRLSDARRRVSACFHEEGATEKHTWKLRFFVEFSPEGDVAVAKILRSDAPDPRMQECALRELRLVRGWAARGGSAVWETEWAVGDARQPAVASAQSAAGDRGYGYEFQVDPVTEKSPPLGAKLPPLPQTGRLPPEHIQHVIRAAFPRLHACYEAGRAKNPALAGRVVLRFVIGQDGRVADVELDGSDVADPAVVGCVSKTAAGLRFPGNDMGIVWVVYPLAFGAGSAD